MIVLRVVAVLVEAVTAVLINGKGIMGHMLWDSDSECSLLIFQMYRERRLEVDLLTIKYGVYKVCAERCVRKLKFM